MATKPRVSGNDAPSAAPVAEADRVRAIAAHFRTIIELLGLDLEDPNRVESPSTAKRIARIQKRMITRDSAQPRSSK
ncbi:MAG: hypothetical protein ACM3NW_04190, partial [Syntrophomonadaceae bacterium]